MRYNISLIYCRPWTLSGIIPRLIESHYQNDYGSALNRLYAITEEIEALDPTMSAGHQPPQARRGGGIEFNTAA